MRPSRLDGGVHGPRTEAVLATVAPGFKSDLLPFAACHPPSCHEKALLENKQTEVTVREV